MAHDINDQFGFVETRRRCASVAPDLGARMEQKEKQKERDSYESVP